MQLFTNQHNFTPQKTQNFNKTVRTLNFATILSSSMKEIMFHMLLNTCSGKFSNNEFSFDRFHEITKPAFEI